MKIIFEELLNLEVLYAALFRAFLALIAGSIMGIERGRQGRAAGMRTHILVCLGATLTAMIGIYTTQILGFASDPLRISAQVVSGIGFLGVGTILIKGRFQITGLTTAAGIWCVAAIGLAIGIGFYEGAAVTFIFALIAVTLMHRLEYKIKKRHTRFGIYAEIKSDAFVSPFISLIKEGYRITDIQVTAPRSGTRGNVGIEANVYATKNETTPSEMSAELEKIDYVVFALESI